MQATKTISDVALLAGVSRATVSRVLNGTAKVSPATRDAVQAAIKQTGFTVNPQARALALGRTNSMAVLLTEPFDELYEDPTYAAVLRGINDGLAGTTMFPLLMQVHTEAEQAKALNFLKHRGVDALIHLSPYDDRGILEDLVSSSLPVVMCGQLVTNPYHGRYANVYADDVAGGALAATHAKQTGGSRFAAILGKADNPASVDRLMGYRSVLGAEGLPDSHVVYGDWGSIAGAQGTEVILAQDPFVDTFLCGSDRIAAGVVAALQQRGILVPQEKRVIGFDDHAIAIKTIPTLTTVAQPLRLEGETAVQLAMDMLEGNPPRDVVLEMELKVRHSG